MQELSSFELGWMVGILEGEGCFFLDQRWNGPGSLRIQVKMTDEDVINRLAALWERLLGIELNVHECSSYGRGNAVPYMVSVCGKNARAIMKLVVKHMSWRRRQKIWQCLNGYKPNNKPLDIKEIVKLVAVNA